MDNKQLEIFITAAKYLSFTKTATALNIAQSTVSYSISSLENELNAKLFIRNKGQLALTQTGRIFFEDACHLSSMMRQAIQHTRAETSGTSGALTIAFPFAELLGRFVHVLHDFRENHPFIDLRFLSLDSTTLAERLSSREIDIAFDREIVFSYDRNICWQELYAEPFFAIVSKEHPLAKETSVVPRQLASERILAMSRESNPGMFDMITHLFMTDHIMPNFIATANCHETTLMRARMNEGIVILMRSLFEHNMPDDLVTILIEAPLAQHVIGVAWNRTNEQPALKIFLDHLASLPDIFDA